MNIARFLKDRGVPFTLVQHRDTSTAQEMAHALHVPGRQIAKTVLLTADHGFRHVVAVLPGDRQVDIPMLSHALGGSVIQLASEQDIAEHCPDCEVGALPPFGSQYAMQTIVDASLAELDEITFEGNTHNEAIRMKFSDFKSVEEPLIVPLSGTGQD